MKDFFALKQENIFQFIYQQFCLQIGISFILQIASSLFQAHRNDVNKY